MRVRRVVRRERAEGGCMVGGSAVDPLVVGDVAGACFDNRNG